MLRMTVEPEGRAKGVVLPPWWLKKVRELVDERGGSLTQLGADLAAACGRAEPWDHSAVSRFLRDKVTTAPMAEAFATLLVLPKPFFVARTLDEAFALQATAKRYDSAAVNPEQARRLAVADQIVDSEEESVRDRTPPVKSEDEGTRRSGRSGRSHRGRSSSS